MTSIMHFLLRTSNWSFSVSPMIGYWTGLLALTGTWGRQACRALSFRFYTNQCQVTGPWSHLLMRSTSQGSTQILPLSPLFSLFLTCCSFAFIPLTFLPTKPTYTHTHTPQSCFVWPCSVFSSCIFPPNILRETYCIPDLHVTIHTAHSHTENLHRRKKDLG